jgi:hypothetical protein
VSDERYKCNGVWPLDEISSSLVIDDLVGTIDDLVGMIDGLSTIDISPSTITYGLTDGTLLQDDSTADDDNGVPFNKIITSKVYYINTKDISVTKLLLKYIPRRVGEIQIFFSRNGGATFKVYKTVSFSILELNERKILTCYKHITTSEFCWKIVSLNGAYDVLEYRISGVSTADTRAK